jgi:plastocyanin
MKRIDVFLVSGLCALAGVAGGCGGDDNGDSDTGAKTEAPAQTAPAPRESGGATSSLDLSADPSGAFKFNKSKLQAKAGNVTITMDNPSDVPHGVAVEGNGIDKDGDVVSKGGTSTVTADLKAGTYTFYCPVPGHREGGMEGTLTVK